MANVTCNTAEIQRPGIYSLLSFPAVMLATWRQRQLLKRLDDQLLRDIGHSYRSAKHEADKPIWNVPKHWRR